jgi:sulfoxide reductase heme-binding subunit YedZ
MDRINGALRRVPESAVWALGLLPLAWLVWLAANGGLGPDPVKALERPLGTHGLQFLLASLAVTPLRRVGLNLIRFRRALGLLAFVYVGLHLAVWLALDMALLWGAIWAEIAKRPYILIGTLGFAAMVPLAATSSARAIRAMGAPAWRRLHRLAYVAILAGVLHQLLLVKVLSVEVILYTVAGIALLLLRVVPRRA